MRLSQKALELITIRFDETEKFGNTERNGSARDFKFDEATDLPFSKTGQDLEGGPLIAPKTTSANAASASP